MATTPAAEMQAVRSIERAVDVLQSFSLEQPSMTVAEIGKRVQLSRPTLYRLLHTLERKGLVRSSGEPLRYELGHAVARIAHVWLARLDPARLAAPILARLWDETNETVALCLPQGAMRVCVLEHPGRQPLSYARGVGDVDSMAATASGRAMMAFLPQPEIEAQREKVLLRTMDIGTLPDLLAAERVFGRGQLAGILAGADAGAMKPRSWSFWHYRLGLTAPGEPPPPMPTRRLA